jgi:diguanylate cyclase (GGDEF)-like protein
MLGRPESEPWEERMRPVIDREIIAEGVLGALPPRCIVMAFAADLCFVGIYGDALRNLGWQDADVVGHFAEELMVGNPDAETVLSAYRGALRGASTDLRLSGGTRAWYGQVGPLRDRTGQIVGGLVVGLDVTANEQARRLHAARACAAKLIASVEEDLAGRLVREVAPMLECLAAIYWEAAEDGSLRYSASWVRDGAPRMAAYAAGQQARAAPLSDGLVSRAFETCRWQAIPDLRAVEPKGWVASALEAGARAAAAVPALREGVPVGVFEFFGPVPIEDDPEVAAAFNALVDEVAHAFEGRKRLQALQSLADHDGLTGLLNRRRFEEELRRQVAATARYGRSAALIVLDLDDFKTVNDAHGHAVGDELLREVAGALRRRLRASDVAARLGGDEFAVILDGTDTVAASRVAAQLAADLAAIRLSSAPAVRPLASVGVAPVDGEDGLAALHAADQAMYAAKRTTRAPATQRSAI